MVQDDAEQALLQRIAKRVGDPAAPEPQPQQQAQPSPEEEEERCRNQLLEEIARRDGSDEREDVMRQRFLKAKEASERRATCPNPADEAIKSSGKRQQVRMGNEIYDQDVGKRLDSLGANAQRDDAKHGEFLKAKEVAAARQQEQMQHPRVVEEVPGDGQGAKSLVPTWITEEQYREFGYPQLDKKFKDKEWHRKQMELDMTDPRHNPNLLLDQNDPEFWYNAARKPFAKAILRSEQHWDSRRKTWMKQYENVQNMNIRREEITELLEDASPDVKRILAPIMKYTVTWVHLNNMLNRAAQLRRSFRDCLDDKENREVLEGLRHRIDQGGEEEADAMLMEYDARWRGFAEKLTKEKIEEEKQERSVADCQTLAQVMNWGTKCKKDGILEWEKGNWAEAHASWRQADEALRRFKAADSAENKMFMDLHSAVLKNLAQVCIKLEYWTDAIEAADAAVRINPDDHKAWFRKATALEGVGKIDEAQTCLEKVEECAVGHPDRARIAKDTQAKREKLQSVRERNAAAKQKMLGKALAQGIFSEDRQQPLLDTKEEEPPLPKPKPLEPWQEATRKHLTRDAAEDLLVELTEAYKDSTFQRQIAKLAIDVRQDKRQFLANLKKVALPLQQPVLEKFGFEPSERGVAEMTRAIQDFTRGKRADAKVKARADETTQALYGCMYDMLTRPDAEQTAPPTVVPPLNAGGKKLLDSDSE